MSSFLLELITEMQYSYLDFYFHIVLNLYISKHAALDGAFYEFINTYIKYSLYHPFILIVLNRMEYVH